ncbi:hypothetical protein D3C81_1427390 [compost metagenome]
MIQTKIGNTQPRRAIVAKHRHRIANLVQWLQQVAPGRIKPQIDFVTAVLLAFGEHTGSLGAIDIEVALPAGDGDTERQEAYARTNPQQLALAARYPDVVARQAGLLIDNPPECLLDEIDQRLALRLALTQGKFRLVGLCRFTDKCIAHVAVLHH